MVSIRKELEDVLSERRDADRRTSRRQSVALELAKILVPAILAVGGSWVAMDHRLSVLEAQATANAASLLEVKTMLGIGVYKGANK